MLIIGLSCMGDIFVRLGSLSVGVVQLQTFVATGIKFQRRDFKDKLTLLNGGLIICVL
jgi:hypothetical protein